MTDDDVFPMLHDGSTREEPWDHRYKPLAEILGCSIDDAADAFLFLEFPEYQTRHHLNIAKESISRFNKAIKPAQKLRDAVIDLTPDERQALIRSGTISLQQIDHLVAVLSGRANSLMDWYKNQDRRGGRVGATYTVAEGVRRAFRRNRRPITFGVSDDSPTTDFGRAVERTIAAFGIRSDWRDSAHEAWSKQRSIEMRLSRIEVMQRQRKNLAAKYVLFSESRFIIRHLDSSETPHMVQIYDRLDMSASPLTIDSGHFFAATPEATMAFESWAKELLLEK